MFNMLRNISAQAHDLSDALHTAIRSYTILPTLLVKMGKRPRSDIFGDRADYTFLLKSTRSVRYQESGYKLLSRWYRIPTSLHKMLPGQSGSCWRCGEEEGTCYISYGCARVSNPFETKSNTTYPSLFIA